MGYFMTGRDGLEAGGCRIDFEENIALELRIVDSGLDVCTWQGEVFGQLVTEIPPCTLRVKTYP